MLWEGRITSVQQHDLGKLYVDSVKLGLRRTGHLANQ